MQSGPSTQYFPLSKQTKSFHSNSTFAPQLSLQFNCQNFHYLTGSLSLRTSYMQPRVPRPLHINALHNAANPIFKSNSLEHRATKIQGNIA